MKKVLIILICLLPAKSFAQAAFDIFIDYFVTGYKALNIPELNLSYVVNFQNIQPTDGVKKQIAFFKSIQYKLTKFDVQKLKPADAQDYRQIAFECRQNLERLKLELEWANHKPDTISTAGISTVANGKAWYRYMLKKWLSVDQTPDQIYKSGLIEVQKVEQHITDIQKSSGLNDVNFYNHLNDQVFFIKNPQAVQDSFEHANEIITRNLDRVFYPHKIPDLKITKVANKSIPAPGYYDNNIFYYNLFDQFYNARQIDWLFIHEGVPGHHYQISIGKNIAHSKVQQLFFYMCLAEGWAAYTEDLGVQLGLYRTPYAELGKWEWDIVRSVRVPMDIGLNYYGWSDEQALAFWKAHIHNQDSIALREIARIKRWPAQCITYKYGASEIKRWKQNKEKKEGTKFNIKDFHKRILSSGSLPLFLVEARVNS